MSEFCDRSSMIFQIICMAPKLEDFLVMRLGLGNVVKFPIDSRQFKMRERHIGRKTVLKYFALRLKKQLPFLGRVLEIILLPVCAGKTSMKHWIGIGCERGTKCSQSSLRVVLG